jgi:hypothetical protein
MTWAYLIVFNNKIGDRKSFQNFLDTIPEITYWYGCLPNAVFLTSTLTAGQISDKVRSHFGTQDGQRWFVTEVHNDRQGWLPKEVWHMLKNPTDPKMSSNA